MFRGECNVLMLRKRGSGRKVKNKFPAVIPDKEEEEEEEAAVSPEGEEDHEVKAVRVTLPSSGTRNPDEAEAKVIITVRRPLSIVREAGEREKKNKKTDENFRQHEVT